MPDCPEQDDEETYCDFLKNESRTDFFPERVLCKEPDATTCVKNYRGMCYPRHLYCIHEEISPPKSIVAPLRTKETCRNGAHLNNCELYTCPSFFKCPFAYCTPVHAVCNGKIDCPNGEDERDCQEMSCPGFLLCRDDKVCVHPNDVWRGNVKCPVSMDDKAFHDVDACPTYCECLGNAIICNSVLEVKLPKLQVTLRILVINNTRVSLDEIVWRGDLITLLYLNLNFCSISSVKADHFAPLHFLQILRLRNNMISFLPSSVFLTLSNVKEIDLGHNLISNLHFGIFNGASKLHVLKLDSNKLTSVAPCTFGGLESLAILDLSNNYLTNIGDNIFCGNLKSSLRELYLHGNKIIFITDTIVSHMQSLLRLNITPLQIKFVVLLPWYNTAFQRIAFISQHAEAFLD